MTGRGTWCCGLVEAVVMGQSLDLMILEAFSNLNDPMILFYIKKSFLNKKIKATKVWGLFLAEDG